MVNTRLSPLKICARPIGEADVHAVVELLSRGFEAEREPEFWERALARLSARHVPSGLPRYGYLLEVDGVIVGALLQIYSQSHRGDAVRCNVSSWYVDPRFRSYGALLVSHALKHKNVTYLNISPAPHTRRIAVAHGYNLYSDGVFLAVPSLSARPSGDIRIVGPGAAPDVPFDAHEHALLVEHASYGCKSLWCVTPQRAHAFVFRPRFVKRVVPCLQLIYCSDVGRLVEFARPIGRHLLRRGHPLVMIDSNGPVRGLVGRYFPNTMPKFFKGAQPPRLGDLAYTETALFGI